MIRDFCVSAIKLLRSKVVLWWRFNVTHRYCQQCRHWLCTNNALAGRCFKIYGQPGQSQIVYDINGTRIVEPESAVADIWTAYCAVCDYFEDTTK